MKVACVLLVAWWLAHYGYQWAPAEHAATVFNILRSLASLILLALVALAFPMRLVLLAVAGMAAEEAQVIVCGTWWLWKPWPVLPNQELCSAGLGIPLGSVGLVLIGMLAAHLHNQLRGRHARPTP